MRCSDTPWLERQAQEKCTTHFTKRLVSQVSIRFRPVDLANFHLEFVHPEYIEYRELKYDKEKGMYVCRMTSVRIHSTPWLLLNIETPEKNPNNSMANKHRVTDRAIINLRKKKESTYFDTQSKCNSGSRDVADNQLYAIPQYEKAQYRFH